MNWIRNLLQKPDRFGVVAAMLFLAASLTPSLIPRDAILQGVLSGGSAAFGYLVGVVVHQAWFYLELPVLRNGSARNGFRAIFGLAVVLVAFSAWTWGTWQDSLRVLMDMSEARGGQRLLGALVAAVILLLLFLLGRLFLLLWQTIAAKLRRFVPQRLVNLVAGALAVWLVWIVANVSIFSWIMRVADETYAALDRAADVQISQPTDPLKTGSDASLIDWEPIGRTGRNYLTSGPSRDDLRAYGLDQALEPLRIYVGLRSAETVEERAELALEEMIRVGAFDRSVLIVATPTGTGWLDPSGVDSLEYLHAGDVATVATQYSYLASWMSLFFEPGYGQTSARALFTTVYNYWTELPRDERPRLYIFGLSLGALSSERATHLYEVLGDPHHGAVWVGPPFPSTIWRSVTDDRVEGSPVWLPRFGDGSVIRFTAQDNALETSGNRWGPMRVVYVQYASDPIVFFEPSMFFIKPGWLKAPRGPDVSPSLRWYPVVTALQIGIDVILATEVPRGFGHDYAAANYIDAWVAVTQPPGWDPDSIKALQAWFSSRERD
jgi:uncharacterized membrane protein